MRRFALPFFALLTLIACQSSVPPSDSLATLSASTTFTAHLTSAQEVTATPVVSRAQGQAIVRHQGDALHYRLIVANIENITMAHIHLAPAGANGPVVAWLYPGGPPAQLLPGRTNGVLATGTLTAANLVGPLTGQPLEALVAAIEAGDAYVNVHTSQYPAGEVRGQLR